jgi:hypothetical protein
MWYLSFDCANKSLAIGLYSISNTFKSDIKSYIQLYKSGVYTDQFKEDIQNLIQLAFVDVLDIIPTQKVKDTNIIDRTRALKKALEYINEKIRNHTKENTDKIQVCIEYQMNVNDKSRTVYNQLLYEYADKDTYNLIIMKPLLKNTIYLKESLKYCYIIEKYNSTYRCNKQHSKLNFLHFIHVFQLEEKIKHIQKKNLDDVADTFMQVIAYLLL